MRICSLTLRPVSLMVFVVIVTCADQKICLGQHREPKGKDSVLNFSRPIFFDDFNYNDTTLNGSMGSSIFGYNHWYNGQGYDYTRMWKRYNWDDLPFGSGGEISFDNGVMTQSLNTPFNSGYRAPAVTTGFQIGNRGYGIYGARVRFGGFQTDAKTIQAFWLTSSNNYAFYDGAGDSIMSEGRHVHEWSELDIEWHNWFHELNEPYLDVGNYNGTLKHSSQRMNCMIRQPTSSQVETLEHCKSTGTYPAVIEDQWLYALIRVDHDKVSYSLYAYDFLGQGGELWVGDTLWFYKTADVSLHSPVDSMGISLSMHFFPLQKGSVSYIAQQHSFQVDWIYFSPDPHLELNDIFADIVEIRSNQMSRVNTTGFSFDYRDANHTFSIVDDAPTIVSALEVDERNFFSTGRGTKYDTRVSYTFERCDGQLDYPPIYLATRSPSVLVPHDATRLVYTIEMTNHYYPAQTSSLVRVVDVIGSNCSCIPPPGSKVCTLSFEGDHAVASVDPIPESDFVGDFFPHPIGQGSQITLGLTTPSSIRVAVYDIAGRLLKGQSFLGLSPGIHSLTIEFLGLPSGVYFVTFFRGEIVETRKVILIE